MRVPLVDLVSQQQEIAEEVAAGLDEVFATTSFIGGKPVTEFEKAYADFSGVDHCIGVANGTDALELALRAAGVGPGHEVILPANTFIATAEAVSRIGAVPVLVDVDPDHLLIDPAAVEAAVGPKTKAIVPVHLFGQTAPVEQLTGHRRQLRGGDRRGRGAVAGRDPVRPSPRGGSDSLPAPASTRARTSAPQVTRAPSSPTIRSSRSGSVPSRRTAATANTCMTSSG